MNVIASITRQRSLTRWVVAAAMACTSQLAFAQAAANWEAEWKKLGEAARKEGELNLAISFGVGGLPRVTLDEFEKRFGVKVNMQQFSGGALILPKILQEQQGGVFNYDIIMTSGRFGPALRDGKALIPIRPLLMRPDVLDSKVWANGFEASFRDREKQFGFAPVEELVSHMWINTNLVKPGEFKTVNDLLNPKYKGKYAFVVVSNGGTVVHAMGMRLVYGDDVIKKMFVDMEPTYSRDSRQMLEQLIKGQRALAMAVMDPVIPEFRAQGLMNHIQRIVLEDIKVTTTGNDLWIPQKAPHPNASKLWANWFLSKEGQSIYAKDSTNNSRRLDVEPGAPDKFPRPGEKYVHRLGTEAADDEYQKTADLLARVVGNAPAK